MLPPTYLFFAILAMAGLHFLLPGKKIVPFPWNFFGALPFITGVVLNIVADRAFKKQKTTVKPFEESTVLITGGAYAISRHPMYLGFVLILLGIAIALGSLSPYAIVILFPVLMEIIFIRPEEKMLDRTFGDKWRSYKAKVRRWI